MGSLDALLSGPQGVFVRASRYLPLPFLPRTDLDLAAGKRERRDEFHQELDRWKQPVVSRRHKETTGVNTFAAERHDDCGWMRVALTLRAYYRGDIIQSKLKG